MSHVEVQQLGDGSALIVLDNFPHPDSTFSVEWRTSRGVCVRLPPTTVEALLSRFATIETPSSSQAEQHPQQPRLERNRWIYDLIWCADCGSHVPVFRNLAPPEQSLVEEWKIKRPFYSRIAQATGLTSWLAKSWLLHSHQGPAAHGRWNSTPCPRCARWLRNENAKQCFHCGADWH